MRVQRLFRILAFIVIFFSFRNSSAEDYTVYDSTAHHYYERPRDPGNWVESHVIVSYNPPASGGERSNRSYGERSSNDGPSDKDWDNEQGHSGGGLIDYSNTRWRVSMEIKQFLNQLTPEEIYDAYCRIYQRNIGDDLKLRRELLEDNNYYHHESYRGFLAKFFRSDYEMYLFELDAKFLSYADRKKYRYVDWPEKPARGFVEWVQSESRRIRERWHCQPQVEGAARMSSGEELKKQKKIQEEFEKRDWWRYKEFTKVNEQTDANKEFKAQQEKYKNLIENELEEINEFPFLQEVRDCLEYFKEVKRNSSEDSLEHNLANLGEEFGGISEQKFEDGSREEFDLYKDRTIAIFKTLASNSEISCQNYELNNLAKNYLPKYAMDPNELTSLQGDSVQQNIHKELVDILNNTSELYHAFEKVSHVSSLSTVIFRTSQAIDKCNKDKEYERAYSLSDFCYKMFDVGKKLSLSIFKGAKEGLDRFSDASRKTIETLMDAVFKYPEETADAILTGIENAIGSAALFLAKSLVLMTIDEPEFCRRQVEIVDKIYEKINAVTEQVIERFRGEPVEKIVEESTSFLTETLLSSLAGYVLVGKAAQVAKAVAEIFGIVENEIVFASATKFKNKKAKNIAMPVKNIFEKAGKITQLAAESGPQKINTAIKSIQKVPAILDLEPSVEECVRLVSLNENWNLKGLVHACKGNFRSVEKVINGRLQEKGLISGMHTEKAFEHFKKVCNFKDELFKVEKLNNGVTRIICPREVFVNNNRWKNAYETLANGEKICGIKTLWPADYTPKDILEAAQEIISNPENYIKNGKYCGITKNRIRARVYLNEKGKIVSPFPHWNQLGI